MRRAIAEAENCAASRRREKKVKLARRGVLGISLFGGPRRTSTTDDPGEREQGIAGPLPDRFQRGMLTG